ncbi:hypothetical protein P691DRAFT_689476 [Macrolepiota fuliginosa MF-IS2]|uniref:DUF6533 domain-containing protein n=1 Tax=Macrolepiota fuliginosa MF-IS2 TaxID=1400762 RepID=A0A9P5WWW0_9AGAR|nr:hypothetical protein P691DRAFT_689476 [Macrolepiota fuliginosa MF-IS2]
MVSNCDSCRFYGHGLFNCFAQYSVSLNILQILDWLLTLRMEVSLIWKAPWTLMKGLYLVNRYMPFVDVTIAVFCETQSSHLKRT